VLAAVEPPRPALADPEPAGLRFVTADLFDAATVFARDQASRAVRPSTLVRPTILDYERKGCRTY
jgi:predicted membrane-bound spermidine synthase